MLLSCGVGEDSWEFLGLQGDETSQSSRKSILNIHWKDWCWSWNSNTLAIWSDANNWLLGKDFYEGRRRRGQWRIRGMIASLTWWTWVWASSQSWWWTEKHGGLQSVRSQRVGHDWATELLECLKTVLLLFFILYVKWKSKSGSGGRVNSVKMNSKIPRSGGNYFHFPFRIKKQLGCITLLENMVDGTKDDLTMILCLRTRSKLEINSYALKHGI